MQGNGLHLKRRRARPGGVRRSERRRVARSPVAEPVGIQIVDSGGWRITGISIDRSDRGLGVYAWSPLDPGTVVVTCRESSGRPDSAQLSGVVRRCERCDLGAYRLSIEFQAAHASDAS